MKSKYNKNYFEYYALLSLINSFDNGLKKLKHLDRPDFQSDELSIGLEITRAIDSDTGHRQAIINKYFSKGYTPKEIIESAKNEKRFGDIFKQMDGLCYTKSIPVSFDSVPKRIVKSIIEKTEKFNTIYKVFNHNWLYVFSEEATLEEYDIKKVLSLLLEKDCQGHTFDKIFINAYDKIFVIENLAEIKMLQIGNEQLKTLKSSALELSKKSEELK